MGGNGSAEYSPNQSALADADLYAGQEARHTGMGTTSDQAAMMTPSRIGHALPWLGALARVVLAAVFLWSGLAKASDLALSRLTVRSYQLLPDGLVDLIGDVLPYLELGLALLLLLGVGARIAASLTALLLLAFVIGVSSLWIRGIEAACGCFGTSLLSDGTSTSYPLILARDGGLLVLAVFVAWLPITRWSIDAAFETSGTEET